MIFPTRLRLIGPVTHPDHSQVFYAVCAIVDNPTAPGLLEPYDCMTIMISLETFRRIAVAFMNTDMANGHQPPGSDTSQLPALDIVIPPGFGT